MEELIHITHIFVGPYLEHFVQDISKLVLTNKYPDLKYHVESCDISVTQYLFIKLRLQPLNKINEAPQRPQKTHLALRNLPTVQINDKGFGFVSTEPVSGKRRSVDSCKSEPNSKLRRRM